MQEIISYLPLLGIVILINITTGTYYNVKIEDISFSWNKLLTGIIKALIVGTAFVGLSYVFDNVDLGSLNITPTMVMLSAIALYAGKGIQNLSKILGITTTDTSKTEETEKS